MECKLHGVSIVWMEECSIKIETYWNVNLFARAKQMAQGKIKIETYWNVNTDKQLFKMKNEWIKIETYWNVNTLLNHLLNLGYEELK